MYDTARDSQRGNSKHAGAESPCRYEACCPIQHTIPPPWLWAAPTTDAPENVAPIITRRQTGARPPKFDVITFDCYGRLIDWDAGLEMALVQAVAGRARASELLAAYHRLEPIVEAEAQRGYREVLAETALRASRRVGIEISNEAAAIVAESLPDWAAFPDTNPALERLDAAGYRLGILSNVDDDLLTATLRHFSVGFELIVTAQQFGTYKPAPAHFETARRLLGGSSWLHVAQSYYHDVAPALALGIDVAWINRLREKPGGEPPRHEFTDLTGLANWLAPSLE